MSDSSQESLSHYHFTSFHLLPYHIIIISNIYYFCCSRYMYVTCCCCPLLQPSCSAWILCFHFFNSLFSLLFSFQGFLLIFSTSEISSSIMQSASKPIRGSLLRCFGSLAFPFGLSLVFASLCLHCPFVLGTVYFGEGNGKPL